ncbi:hypothetical protein IFR04_009770 [Cadophora malorum]|uniref:Uncharacterized protein n=1 Tax=Cadophora malorum TaxID=108018 RepID=A0A8H7T8L8_9HELO|nr:hypothetical protein IFR04_009770 [Cadophora malorum]
MNVVQNPVDAVENYSRYSSIQVPCSLLLGAFFQALANFEACGTMVFRERRLGRRIDGLEPRIAAVEEEYRELLESEIVRYKQETNLDSHNESGNLKSVKRSGSADDLNMEENVEERFNRKVSYAK